MSVPPPLRRRRNASAVRRKNFVLRVAAGIIRRDDGAILITQRLDEGSFGGCWEFPGGKLERGESYAEALRRELREEIGVETEIGDAVFTLIHPYPKKTIKLRFMEARIVSGTPRAIEVADWRWVAPADLRRFRFPPADEPLIKKLQSS
jgi:mutator protein MutT